MGWLHLKGRRGKDGGVAPQTIVFRTNSDFDLGGHTSLAHQQKHPMQEAAGCLSWLTCWSVIGLGSPAYVIPAPLVGMARRFAPHRSADVDGVAADPVRLSRAVVARSWLHHQSMGGF